MTKGSTMRKHILTILLFLTGGAMAAVDWTATTISAVPGAQELRGYGRVATTHEDWAGPGGARVGVMRFRCTNAARATTLIGKCLADLTLSAGVGRGTIAGLPVTTLPGGAVLIGCISGAEGRIVSADSADVLEKFAADYPAQVAGAVAEAPYATYLDRFDRYGWGCYGMGGFSNFHDWMFKADGQKTPKDPAEDVRFMIEHKFRFEPWLDPVGFDTSDGIRKNTEHEWMTKLLTDAGMPFSFRVYGNAGGADWTARRFPEYIEQPADFMMSGWLRPQLHSKSSPHLTWFDRDIHRYMATKTMAMMQPYAEHPLNMGWMHPHGELAHDPWYDLHDDYAPAAQRNWQAYLRGQGLSLADVSRLYGHAGQPFAAWEQVGVPEYATFAGLPGQVQSLAGTWFWRRERETAQKEDTTFPGLAANWHKAALDTTTWKPIELPGSETLYEVLPPNISAYATTWFRHTFQLTPAQVKTAPIYLYWFPMSFGGIHSGEHARFHGVFINGEVAGRIGMWGALDVTKLLKPGQNEISVQLFGGIWNGRIFLSTDTPSVYPYLGKDRNRLFLLWQDWHKDAKFAAWSDVLDGMRQVDPNRPIKFMAPIKFGADRWLKLARAWGGFGHFTGEGMWYFPWYKRYGFLYDLPATSEMGQPNDSIPQLSATLRRTFLAGLNGHDPVFLAQTYTRNAELRKWWVDHNPVLKRMGTYDIAGPQVLLYRSTQGTELVSPKPYPQLGQSTREIQNSWNWDIGRGTLQTLGQSYLYLDDGGLTDGKMVGYPLMIDSGNETMPETSVAAIAEWVHAGGTFVTLPFTGRNSPLEPDVWPIVRLTGCRVTKLRQPGQGEIIFGKTQRVFTALAGKRFPDAGRSLDWVGNNLNILSTELDAGQGGEVLATFENGAPAIVRRKIGAGSVIVLGTAFWRQSQDRAGIWWPEVFETDFIADLLQGAGFPAAECTTDDRMVWPQPYRANNGLDAVTCLVNWHDDKDVPVTVRLRLAQRPAALTSYGIDGVKPVAFTWKDGVATATVPMPAKEVKVLAAAVYSPRAAVEHWWQYQQKMWHELNKPTIDFSPYYEGKWVDPTLDLHAGVVEFTTVDPTTGGAQWTPCQLSIVNFYGAKANQPVWVRTRFRVPEAWMGQGGQIRLVSGSWSGPHYQGSARLSLNGTLLHDFPGGNYQEFDVSRLLKEGENELLLAFKGDRPYQGISGNLYLYHVSPPARKLDLAGAWDAEDANGMQLSVTFPGTARCWAPAREFFLPKEWEGRYTMRLHLEGGQHDTAGAIVNGRLARRHHHWFATPCDIDITRFLRFGASNRLELMHAYGSGPREAGKAPGWDLRKVELHLRAVE
jgi:hypothetical protein